MVEVANNPTFESRDFGASNKKSGISAIIGLHNEEDYLEQAFESILPFFDEFVIIYKQCSD